MGARYAIALVLALSGCVTLPTTQRDLDKATDWAIDRVETETIYEIETRPRVVVVPDLSLDAMRNAGFHMPAPYDGAQLWAVYFPSLNTIGLHPDWHHDDVWQRSVLLHEMVHAAQAQNGARPCRETLEREAVTVQARYLSEASGAGFGPAWVDAHTPQGCR